MPASKTGGEREAPETVKEALVSGGQRVDAGLSRVEAKTGLDKGEVRGHRLHGRESGGRPNSGVTSQPSSSGAQRGGIWLSRSLP